MSLRSPMRLFLAAGAVALSASSCVFAADSSSLNPTPSPLTPFPAPLSGVLPYDVTDVSDQVGTFVAQGRIAQAQRLFDIMSWKSFIALNWPANSQGKPILESPLKNHVPVVWEYLINATQVFKADGSAPDAWGTPAPVKGEGIGRGLSNVRAAAHPKIIASDTLQAFSGPLVDQNGKWARFEILMNDVEYNYIVQNKLYNQEGQEIFSRTNSVDMPVNIGTTQYGAMEVKLAWKILGPNDIKDRFLVRKADIYNPDTGKYEPHQAVGLVGMHISVKTQSAPQWIWTTFEQIDNVQVRDPELKLGDQYIQHKPSFYNPDTPVALPNQEPPMNAVTDPTTGLPVPATAGQTPTTWYMADTTTPVQVTRVIPIDPATQALNAQVQALLRQAGSVLQYYQLIGTQWPVNPQSPAVPGGANSAPESITRKTPGAMIPVYLTNSIMETYFQKGIQPAGPLEEDDRLAPSNAIEDSTSVFGTESCVGCHYSAGIVIGFKRNINGQLQYDANGNKIPIFGENANAGLTGSADFSWLFQIYSQPAQKPVPQKN